MRGPKPCGSASNGCPPFQIKVDWFLLANVHSCPCLSSFELVRDSTSAVPLHASLLYSECIPAAVPGGTCEVGSIAATAIRCRNCLDKIQSIRHRNFRASQVVP